MNIPPSPNDPRDHPEPDLEPSSRLANGSPTAERLLRLHRENRDLLAESSAVLERLGTTLYYLAQPECNLKLAFAILDRHWRMLANLQGALIANETEARSLLERGTTDSNGALATECESDPATTGGPGFAARRRGLESSN